MKLIHIFCICVVTFCINVKTSLYVVHEKQAANTIGWQKRSRLHPEIVLPMRVALAHKNTEMAEESLARISDPSSPQFSQHWSARDVAKNLAPSKESIIEVIEWLNDSGIVRDRVKVSPSWGWIYFNATVSEIEQLLVTKYHVFERGVSGDTQAACDEYSLPRHLQKTIDFVEPTIHLAKSTTRNGASQRFTGSEAVHRKTLEEIGKTLGTFPRRGLSIHPEKALLERCHQYTTIHCLQALYDFQISNASHPNNSFGIFEVAWTSWLPDDLDSFFNAFMPSLSGHRPLMELVDGGYQETYKAFSFNAEADLDIEYSMALTYPQKVTNYQVGDKFSGGTLNDLLAAVDKSYCGLLDPEIDGIYPDRHLGGYNNSDCGNHKLANVISVSYANDEVAYPPAYQRRQCIEFLKLGLQGITIIVSSGDHGVAGLNDQCLNSSTGQVDGSSIGNFNPSFPASCPFVTSVGGTQLPVNARVSEPEMALSYSLGDSKITSGGGFSNVFDMPSYQRSIVHEYLSRQNSELKNASARFFPGGRGFPDVSANAANYVTAIDGNFVTVRGTSASAPVFASIITKINDARLNVGKRPVGFINPVLYSNPSMLNDIVSGANYGCGAEGFRAVEGWDPVTGLGTPNYKRILELYLQLP